ncbi:N-acetyltransferase family protein [Microbacterium sp. NPDC076911]|uniref:GNAT family N-acetyltransferase n=1 Tax=Microbacterium sp. NPDC076911 TaxID=3154958 RepID=UPI003414A4CD
MTQVRSMDAADWPAVETIYAAGINDGQATFETSTPSWAAFDAGKLRQGRLVAVDDAGAVVGWVAASRVSSRPAYRGVVEHSVYVAPTARGRGIGRILLEAFIDACEQEGVWTIQASVFAENVASQRLHESLGFRVVGTRQRVARAGVGPAAGTWRDTVLIERRSTVVGAD